MPRIAPECDGNDSSLAQTKSRRLGLDLHHNLPGRDLLALHHIDRRNHPRDRGRMHMFHLHGFQRHHRLAGHDALAQFDQNRHDTAIHRGANLAVAAGCRGGCGRRHGQIADRERDAAVQDEEPVTIAEESCGYRKAVAAEADAIAAEFIDFEAVFATIETCDVAAIALARDFEFVDAMIEFDTKREAETLPPGVRPLRHGRASAPLT